MRQINTLSEFKRQIWWDIMGATLESVVPATLILILLIMALDEPVLYLLPLLYIGLLVANHFTWRMLINQVLVLVHDKNTIGSSFPALTLAKKHIKYHIIYNDEHDVLFPPSNVVEDHPYTVHFMFRKPIYDQGVLKKSYDMQVGEIFATEYHEFGDELAWFLQ